MFTVTTLAEHLIEIPSQCNNTRKRNKTGSRQKYWKQINKLFLFSNGMITYVENLKHC